MSEHAGPYYVSGSRLQGVDACPGSAALPKIAHKGEKADMGSAFHDHGRDRTLMLPGDAAARISEHAEAWGLSEVAGSILAARARSWEWQPPPGTLSEVALGLFEDGSVALVTGARGAYQVIPPYAPQDLRVATRVDFFWAEPQPLISRAGAAPRCPPGSLLWGIDLKTGVDTWVAPVERNLQALCAAILPAIWTGARSCVPAIVYPAPGQGTWDVGAAPLDEAGIARGRDLLLAIAARANAQRARAAQHQPLSLVEGAHCTWCDSAIYCPAKIATLKSYLGNPRPFDGIELTGEEAIKIAELLPAFKRFTESAEEALRRRADTHGVPIGPLSDGTVWGPTAVPKKVIDPVIGERALAAAVGPERAAAAVKAELSDKAIREAVRKLHVATGVERQGAATVRAIYREIREHDGIKQRQEIQYRRHRPADLLEAGGEMTIDASGEIDGDD